MTKLGSVLESLVDCEHKTAPRDESGEFFAVGTPAMAGNRVNYSQARRISAATFATWTRRMKPGAGDLLLAREAPVGPVVMIPTAENVAPGQRTVLMRPNPRAVDSRYLYLALSAPATQLALQEKAAGSTVAHLNVADIRSFRFPWTFPSLHTQRAIAEVLGALDDKIAANSRISDATDDLCEALFEEFAGCEKTTMAMVAAVNEQSVKPGEGEIRYLDISSVSVGSYSRPDVIKWADAPGRARRLVRPGDTVWSTVRPSRRSHALVLDDDLIGSTGLAVISPTTAGAAFVYQTTKTPQFTAYLEGVAEGSAYPAVRANRFLHAPVPAVDSEARDRFESVAYPARLRAHAAAVESRRLATLRDTLLPHLMSGRITVRDAEKAVENA